MDGFPLGFHMWQPDKDWLQLSEAVAGAIAPGAQGLGIGVGIGWGLGLVGPGWEGQRIWVPRKGSSRSCDACGRGLGRHSISATLLVESGLREGD
jgi:hypothetical protein